MMECSTSLQNILCLEELVPKMEYWWTYRLVQFLATVTSAVMNVDIYLCGGLTRWPKSGIGSYSPTFSCFSRNLHADDLHHGSHPQWIRILFYHISTTTSYHLFFFFSLMITFPNEVRWNHKAVFKLCMRATVPTLTTCRSWFSHFTMWVPGIEFQWSGLVASTFTLQVIPPALKEFLFLFPW